MHKSKMDVSKERFEKIVSLAVTHPELTHYEIGTRTGDSSHTVGAAIRTNRVVVARVLRHKQRTEKWAGWTNRGKLVRVINQAVRYP